MTSTTSFSNTGNIGSTGKWIKRVSAAALLGAVAVLIGACGGGGASTTGAPGASTATLAVLPTTTAAYGNTSVTFTLSGGKPPYTASSSNSSLIPISTPVGNDGKLTVSPKTPAIDTDVTLTFRDSSTAATSVTATANLKASTLSSSLTITPSASGTQCVGICSGGNGIASVQAVVAGVPGQGRSVRFDAFQGDFGFVAPGASLSDPTVATITVTTDNQGFARVVIRAKNAAPSQSAIIQLVDVPSGEVRRFVFSISQVSSSTEIVINPARFDWTSPFRDACVISGITNHYISGGIPPYTVSNTSPDFATFSPAIVLTEGGAVTVITKGFVCSSTGVSFVVRDSTSRTASFIVSNTIGPSTGPSVGSASGIQPPTVTPNALGPIACGASGSAFVDQANPTGAALTLSATSLEPNRVTALITNGQLTATRASNGVGGGSSVLVRVSNSLSFTDVAVALSGIAPFGCGANAGAGTITVSGSASVTVAAGTLSPQSIAGGTAPYTVVSSNTAIATVASSGASAFTITGVTAGTTFVTITDATGASTILVVTVSTATALSITSSASTTAQSVTAGTSANFGITGGAAPFSAAITANPFARILTATISGNVLTVSVSAGPPLAGAGTVVVTDSLGATLAITINIP